jgi:hypothetical protein
MCSITNSRSRWFWRGGDIVVFVVRIHNDRSASVLIAAAASNVFFDVLPGLVTTVLCSWNRASKKKRGSELV